MSTPNSGAQTFLAPDSFIRGDMHFNSAAHLAGHIEGRIEAEDTLEIAASGVIDGDIIGMLVDVQGTVNGNIVATRSCRLGPTARVTGEIRAANLAIAEGASFVGQVCVGSERPATDTVAPAAKENPRAAELFAPVAVPVQQPAEVEPMVTFPNRVVQLAREEAPVAAAMESVTTSAPTVRIMTQNVQQTLQRGPRIIKAR